jgi:hypothetical protein
MVSYNDYAKSMYRHCIVETMYGHLKKDNVIELTNQQWDAMEFYLVRSLLFTPTMIDDNMCFFGCKDHTSRCRCFSKDIRPSTDKTGSCITIYMIWHKGLLHNELQTHEYETTLQRHRHKKVLEELKYHPCYISTMLDTMDAESMFEVLGY